MELVNIFENDAFSIVSMTDAIEQAPTQPNELGEAGIFIPTPERSNLIGIEYRDGQLQIAGIDERGDQVEMADRDERMLRYFRTKRVARRDRISASELQFVNGMGDLNTAVQAVQQEIARRQTGPTGLMAQCENRLELMRLGALMGKVLDQNGKTVWDFFQEFGIVEPPAIDLALSTLAEGALREKIEKTIVRPMRRKAKGLIFRTIEARCGEGFWDALMKNPEFYQSYNEQQKGEERREGTLGTSVKFAGIIWREYFGADDGTSVNIPADECRIYPGGETGMFKHAMSPGETFTDLGTLGKEWYSYTVMDPEGLQRFVDLWVMTYPGMFNTRPDMVFTATHS